jgi:predicted membrane protein
MLNEERVVLMTKLASYEQRKGKKNIRISKYFRTDYLLLQILKTLLYATVSFALMLGLYVLYNFENLTENLYQMDLLGFVKQIVMLYVVFVAVSCVVTYILYSYRYMKARKSLREFMSNLKKLNAGQ